MAPGDLAAVELLGGGSRIPAVKAALVDVLAGRGLDMYATKGLLHPVVVPGCFFAGVNSVSGCTQSCGRARSGWQGPDTGCAVLSIPLHCEPKCALLVLCVGRMVWRVYCRRGWAPARILGWGGGKGGGGSGGRFPCLWVSQNMQQLYPAMANDTVAPLFCQV